MKIKNALTIFLILTIIFSAGCARRTQNHPQNLQNKLSIATSFYPIYILTLNVTKDIEGVTVTNISKPQTGCLHDYQLTTDDLSILEDSQIFIINGAGMESFIDKVISQIPNIKIVNSTKGISLIKNSDGKTDNPHAWLDINNAIKQVENIGNQLAEIDKPNADKYRQNVNNYIKKLKNLENEIKNQLYGVKNRDIITFHEAFPYFAKEFGLNIAAVIEREPGSEPSAGELAEIITTVKNLNIGIIFAEPQYSAKSAQTIARETGAKLYTLDPIVTGPNDADAYISIMKRNLEVLKSALK
ncbi:MAG: metal ABC transporter substrate-binding protein [Ignavibacteriales bacterium]